mgnify:CR=1 FL=1
MISILRKLTTDNAILLLSLCMLGWAGNTIAGRLSSGEISPMVIVFLRWAIVASLLFFFRFQKILNSFYLLKGKIIWLCCMGALGYTGFNSLFYISAHYTSAINLGIIQGTMPAIILIGSLLFFKEKTNLIQIFGLIFTFIGVLILVSQGELQTLLLLTLNHGDLIMFFSCFLYSGFTLGLRKKPNIDPFALMFFFSIVALISSFLGLWIEYRLNFINWPSTYNEIFIIIYIALVPSLISQMFFIRGVELIGADKAALFINLVPLFSAFLGVIILNERLKIFHLSSLIIILLGIYLFMILGEKVKNSEYK